MNPDILAWQRWAAYLSQRARDLQSISYQIAAADAYAYIRRARGLE